MSILVLTMMLGWVHPPQQKVVLTSDELNILFMPLPYLKARAYDSGMYVFITGYFPDREPMTVFRWDKTGFQKVFRADQAQYLFYSIGPGVTPDGGTIYLSDPLTTLIFTWDGDQGLKRFANPGRADDLFWYKDRLFGGLKFPENRIFLISGPDYPHLDKLNRMLPEAAFHPSEGRITINGMCFAVNEDKLFITYNLYDEVLCFDLGKGEPLEPIKMGIPFPGYLHPPKDFNVQRGDSFKKDFLVWRDTHHHLEILSIHRGELYGLFQKGEGAGVWARLSEPGKMPFFWDNNVQETHTLALLPEELILGQDEETADGVVRWTIWRSSSFPSSPDRNPN